MKKFVNIIPILILFIIGSCSTKKNSFFGRSYHTITTKNNILYNGNLALEEGVNELNNQYQDNYWEILPLEPLKIEDKFEIITKTKEESEKTKFDVAEEKAVKSVQKHSMYIEGKERNKQIDDAYLLLGKARYFSQRFIPALEAFDYSIKNNRNSELSNAIRLWRAKTQIRLQNEENALAEINKVLSSKKITNPEKELAYTTLAMSYMALDSLEKAEKSLLKAIQYNFDHEQHARNLFVLGQLYKTNQKNDSANWAFNKVIDYRNSPDKYRVHAYLQKVKITDKKDDLVQLEKELIKLVKNPYNNEFYDEIYFDLANIDFIQGEDQKALSNLNKSIKTPKVKNFQKVLSYEKLGDYYFDKNDFIKAANYYDSIKPYVENKNTKHIKTLERKIRNLEDVVLYESLLKNNDSILKLSKMDEVDRNKVIQDYINKLKKEDEIANIQKENAERNAQTPENTSNVKQLKTLQGGKWYFYNKQTIQFGVQDFVKIWGKRQLKDNWRLNETDRNITTEDTDPGTEFERKNKKKEDPRYLTETYLKSLPQNEEEMLILKNENADALYNLGLIYKEKFQLYPLAKEKLERFLAENQKSKLNLPAKYHLYKIYEKLGSPESNEIKNQILTEYPTSRYALQLQNNFSNQVVSDSINTPEQHYEKVYCDFEYDKFESVVLQCDEAIKIYSEEPILAKFELLKAFAIYHTNGKTKFIEGLEYVINSYPKTEEGIYAQEVLDRLNGIVKTKPIKQEIFQENEFKEDTQEKEKTKELSEDEKKARVMDLIQKKKASNKEEEREK